MWFLHSVCLVFYLYSEKTGYVLALEFPAGLWKYSCPAGSDSFLQIKMLQSKV